MFLIKTRKNKSEISLINLTSTHNIFRKQLSTPTQKIHTQNIPSTININKRNSGLTIISGPTGHSIPAQVLQTSEGVFKAEFVPRMVGEHRVSVNVQGQATAGSPYSAKVCLIKDYASVFE